jgi:acyl-CoA thioester hydrolase
VSSLLPVRVRLSDTNARGCVDDTRLLVFFEEARADAIRGVGMPYSEFLARGVRALTVEARLRNHAPAIADDLLLVHTSVAEVGRLRFTFTYEIRRETDSALIASGETVHICIEAGREQPGRVPDWLRDTLNRLRAPDRLPSETGGE